MQIFDEIKKRGVEDVLFISMDGAKAIFPKVKVQRCIVHLVRNSIKGAFPNENALLKLLYLRVTELYKKWNGSKGQNRAMVRNQLAVDPAIRECLLKYEKLDRPKMNLHTLIDTPVCNFDAQSINRFSV